MAGNSKHKKRVKLRRAAREVKEIEMRRGDAKRLSRSLDRFEAAMFSPTLRRCAQTLSWSVRPFVQTVRTASKAVR